MFRVELHTRVNRDSLEHEPVTCWLDSEMISAFIDNDPQHGEQETPLRVDLKASLRLPYLPLSESQVNDISVGDVVIPGDTQTHNSLAATLMLSGCDTRQTVLFEPLTGKITATATSTDKGSDQRADHSMEIASTEISIDQEVVRTAGLAEGFARQWTSETGEFVIQTARHSGRARTVKLMNQFGFRIDYWEQR